MGLSGALLPYGLRPPEKLRNSPKLSYSWHLRSKNIYVKAVRILCLPLQRPLGEIGSPSKDDRIYRSIVGPSALELRANSPRTWPLPGNVDFVRVR